MENEGLQFYLKKYTQLIQKLGGNTETVIEVLNKHLNTSLDKSQIKIKGTILRVKVSSGENQQLFMYKNKIIKELQDRGVVVTEIN